MSFINKALGVFGTRVFMIGLSLISGIIVTRILGPTNRGALEILIVIPNLVVSFGNLGIGNANLYFIAKDKYPIETIVANSLSVSIILGGALFLLSLIFASFTTGNLFKGIPRFLFFIGFSTIPFFLFQRYAEYIFLGKELIHLRNKLNIFPAIISFSLILLLVVGLRMNILGVLITQVFGSIIALFTALYLLSKISKLQLRFSYKLFLESISYGIIPFLALVILNLNFRLDIFLIKYFLDNTQVGFYSLGVSLGEKMWLIPEAISLVLFASISNVDKKTADILTPKVCRITLLFVSCAALVLLPSGNYIITLLYGNQFKPSVTPFIILLPGIVAMTLYLLIHSDLTGRGKARITLKVFSYALLLNFALNVLLIPKMGINGAALASTISYTLGAFWLCFEFSKETGINLNTILIFKKSDYRDYIAPLLRRIGILK